MVQGEHESLPGRLGLPHDVRGEAELVPLDETLSDPHAARLEEGVGHGAADEYGIGFLYESFKYADLVGDLRASEDGDEGPLGMCHDIAEVLHLLLHQIARGAPLYVLSNARDGSVRPMRRPESIVYVEISEARQRTREAVVVLLLLFVKAEVLKENDPPVLHPGDRLLDALSDAVGELLHILAHERREPRRHGVHPERFHDLPLRPSKVAHQDGLPAALDDALDGGEGRRYPGVVGDPAVICQGDVEINADKNALPLQIEVVYRQRGHIFLLFPFSDSRSMFLPSAWRGRRSGSSSRTRYRTTRRPSPDASRRRRCTGRRICRTPDHR